VSGSTDPRPPAAGRRWLVTGAAGFIGSHLLEALLRRGEAVVGLDNLATGAQRNVDDALGALPADARSGLTWLAADIRDLDACRRAVDGVTHVLHQAALGSVPRSIVDPLTTHAVNVDGFANLLVAAREAGVERFVYASSSSVYGDSPAPQKREGEEGRPLSPYAASKRMNEILAAAFASAYSMHTVGLRYFNVYGPRQDPAGPYAAVIPRWIGALLGMDECRIYGDGETSRDFTYVADVVRANLDAAERAPAGVYNIARGERTTLNDLFRRLSAEVSRHQPAGAEREPRHEPFRAGDVRNSLADITRARAAFGFAPAVALGEGLALTVDWFAGQARA
jgi:UDP-N-acetylglucosamine 4-epimerase